MPKTSSEDIVTGPGQGAGRPGPPGPPGPVVSGPQGPTGPQGPAGGGTTVGPTVLATTPVVFFTKPLSELQPGNGALSVSVKVTATYALGGTTYATTKEYLAVYSIVSGSLNLVEYAISTYKSYYGSNDGFDVVFSTSGGGANLTVSYSKVISSGNPHTITAKVDMVQAYPP